MCVEKGVCVLREACVCVEGGVCVLREVGGRGARALNMGRGLGCGPRGITQSKQRALQEICVTAKYA